MLLGIGSNGLGAGASCPLQWTSCAKRAPLVTLDGTTHVGTCSALLGPTLGPDCMEQLLSRLRTFNSSSLFAGVAEDWVGRKVTPPPQASLQGLSGDAAPCPLTYLPVCDSGNGTHSNACAGEAKGAIIVCKGHCPCPVRPPGPDPVELNPSCNRYVRQPVCGLDGSAYECAAAAAGVGVACGGPCPCPGVQGCSRALSLPPADTSLRAGGGGSPKRMCLPVLGVPSCMAREP